MLRKIAHYGCAIGVMAAVIPRGKLEVDHKRKKEFERDPGKFMAAPAAVREE
jgi:hypothetical protein